MGSIYDVLIIGGGINGCGIARDAAGRGLKVCLCEKNDLASGTSSSSSKMIHGGLRYLENYEFNLVRKALKERIALMDIAPHLVNERRFILPYTKGMRPIWLLRIGMFLYDNLYLSKRIQSSNHLKFNNHASKGTLKTIFKRGFEYSDCMTNDARLVISNAMDAKLLGADIRTKNKVVNINKHDNLWHVDIKNSQTKNIEKIRAKIIINASGPWVDLVLQDANKQKEVNNVRLVKGSHIIVKKIYKHNYCYIMQNDDGRIFFTLPFENDFTIIGTTDEDFQGDLDKIVASESEIEYLCKSASNYFNKKIEIQDVISHYSGVRPLYNDGKSKAQNTTRDYVLTTEKNNNNSALINVFGGKITTYRVLAEKVTTKIMHILEKQAPSWTSSKPLPGGDLNQNELTILKDRLIKKYDYLDKKLIKRLIHLYGSKAKVILASVQSKQDLGKNFGHNLYQQEVDYLLKQEFACTSDDILHRRTNLYLKFSANEVTALSDYLQQS